MTSSIISPVRAISTASEDWMKRQPFAEKLGQAIKGWNQSDSLVIGLHGKWGSGKSSVKNLCLEYLRKQKDKPAVIEFTPWLFTNQEELLAAFFRELGAKANSFEKAVERDAFAQDWKLYSSTMKLASPVLLLAPALLPFLAPLLGANAPDPESFKQGIAAGKLMLDAGIAVGDVTSLSVEQEAGSKKRKEKQPASLEELKLRIFNRLSKKGHRGVLVVIDELDRLKPEYMHMMLQLVKSCADFPGIVYLLCYEREVLEKALTTSAYRGADFLEKIVQVSFNIPEASPEMLHRHLENKILELISTNSFDDDPNLDRWNIGFDLLKKSFLTPREIYRYLNAMSFQISLFKDSSGWEVNPVDLAVLEALRLFEPKVYDSLYRAKNLLFNFSLRHRLLSGTRDEVTRKELAEKIEKVVSVSSEPNREWCLEVLQFLFPYFSSAFGKSNVDRSDSDSWDLNLRVCDELAFERYFQLTVPSNDLTRQETDDIINSLSKRSSALSAFRKYHKKDMLKLVLGKLDSRSVSIPTSVAKCYFEVLLQISEETNNYELASSSITSYLRELKNPVKSGELLVAACKRTHVFAPVIFMVRAIHERRKTEPSIIDEISLRTLEQIATRKLFKAAKSGDLVGSSVFLQLTFCWGRWCDLSDIKAAIEKAMATDDGLWQVLENIFRDLPEVEDESDFSASLFFGMDLAGIRKWFEQFTNRESLSQRLETLAQSSNLSKKQLRICECISSMFPNPMLPETKVPEWEENE